MPSCKLCKKAGLKGEICVVVGLSLIECALDLNTPSNRPPPSTNTKLIERTRSNRGNTVCEHHRICNVVLLLLECLDY